MLYRTTISVETISALPWSAVIMQTPPFARIASTTLPKTFVSRFDRFNRRLQHPGMANHIRVREVKNNHIMFVCFDFIHKAVRYFISAHFRLQIIRRNFRRVDQIRVSPGNSASRPPLKKNVTCGYFSVSAMRSCFNSFCAKLRQAYYQGFSV